MTTVTLEGTQELMKARETAVILATGGMGLVRAAYSAGKPAYGVGPGNAPAYIESSADVPKAVQDIITGKTFDNGLLCSSENSVVCDAPLVQDVKRQFVAGGAHFMLGKSVRRPACIPNPCACVRAYGGGVRDRGLHGQRRSRRVLRPARHHDGRPSGRIGA